MKIKIEVDCTPKEAREFMGLPDVEQIQKAVMEQLQARMTENIAQLSPEKMMQSWFDPNMANRFQDMFAGLAGLSTGRTPGGKK